jgi:hypothetical protein
MKNIYEVFDEFEEADGKKAKMAVIEKNLSQTLVQVLELAFHPTHEWLIDDIPTEYKIPHTLPGISPCQLSTEIRKLYLFKKGHPSAEQLTPEKRKQLLLQLIESIEPREAEVVGGILRKDLGVKGLTYKFVKEAFPDLIP